MEISWLSQFVAVAEVENINRAANNLAVSPGALSKTIAKLESELGTPLFRREKQRIRLTEKGRELQIWASKILHLEESARLAIGGEEQEITVRFGGQEVLLSEYGVPLMGHLEEAFPSCSSEFIACEPDALVKKVLAGEVHLGLTTALPPKEVHSKTIDKVAFRTCVGYGHPLAKTERKKAIPIAEVLEYGFVAPLNELFGKLGQNQSFDGWRDDKFYRKIKHRVSDFHTLSRIVESGAAIAYIPDYLVQSMQVSVLDITGCPYSCKQNVYLICRDPKEFGWMNYI